MDEPIRDANVEMRWGSDVAAAMVRELGFDYICINPGSSFRGLHDSLVNYLGNERPELLLSLHEESVIAIAHGYAKAAGRPMAAVVHSNVGLMAGMMSIFNAWCDRVPMLILGATGAVDAAVRRSWIDWMHTVRDLGGMVRPFVKWDDQPASPDAMTEAIGRSYMMACSAPRGPAYVILDRRLQEDPLPADVAIPPAAHFQPEARILPSAASVAAIADMLASAKSPVILVGRVSQDIEDWKRRIELAELLDARVITDLRSGASFPTDHPLHGAPPDLFLTEVNREILTSADVVLSLDWLDVSDVVIQARRDGSGSLKLVHVSVDHYAHNGWSGDHQRYVAADLRLSVEPDAAVEALLSSLSGRERKPARRPASAPATDQPRSAPDAVPTLTDIGWALAEVKGERELCLARVPLNWPAGTYDFQHPLDYLGYDGGGGVGSGPGMTVGAALALRGSGRPVVGLMGDGEFLAAPSALWTAAHYQIPMLMVIANNRSYYTDEIQQEAVAAHRNRPPENKWIGQQIDNPAIDIPGLARDFGVESETSVVRVDGVAAALERGLRAVESGRPYLVDIRVDPTRGSSMDWLTHH